MPLLIVALGIALLLVLIMVFRFNAFLALLLVALGVGWAIGMPLLSVVDSIQKGVGSTLGYLALILGLGAMLGELIADSGAALVITNRLRNLFGEGNIQWAMLLTGFIVGIPLFYTVGFLMLIPIIFAVARSTQFPLLYVGIPMISALSVTHGFLPPHPAPTAIVEFYGADINQTLLYGLLLAVPTVIIAGPFFARTLKGIQVEVPAHLYRLEERAPHPPGFWTGVLTGLIPVFLMAGAAVTDLTLEEGHAVRQVMGFLGHPVIALLAAVLVGTYTLGVRRGRSFRQVMENLTGAVKAIAMIMLIIAGGGAFKQVLVDSGISDYVVGLLREQAVSPLVLAWIIAAALRISLGSATVAALTAAGIAAPLVNQTDVSPELLVLATGAGSLTCSQVNDTGFWLFKEYFNLSVGQTFRSWTLMETIISVVGLAGCLLLDQLI